MTIKTNPLRHNHIRKIYKDRRGDLWIASDGGVARYNKYKDNFDYFVIRHHSQNYDTKWSYDLYEDYKGRLWIASYLGGLFIVNINKFSSVKEYVEADTVLLGCPIYQIENIGAHEIVANTQNGIVRINVESLKIKEYGAYDDIMTVFNGKIWYSSEARLYEMDLNGKKREVPYDKGSAYRILSFVKDDEYLWFSSYEGIFYYNKRKKCRSKIHGRT